MKIITLTVLLTLGIVTFITAGNTIDAVSSASKKFRVESGTAYEDYAAINWYSGYSNGQVFLDWGLDPNNYSDGMEFYSHSRGYHDDTLTNLKPGSTYYFDLWTRYGGKDRHTCLGSFNTLNKVVSISIKQGAPVSGLLLFPVQNGARLQLSSQGEYKASLFSINGREITSVSGVADFNGSASVDFSSYAVGSYILQVKTSNHVLNYKLAITRK